MFSAKSQRRAWAPRATPDSANHKNGTNFGERRSLPINTSFRGTYSWGPANAKAKNANGDNANGGRDDDTSPKGDNLPMGDNLPKEAYCTVEEIQLGKRHSKSPVMGNGVGGMAGRIQWRQHKPEGEGKSAEQEQDELEENHYEDGDEAEGHSSNRREGHHEKRPEKPLPPKVPPLPPPFPPPKLFGNGKREVKPRAKSNLARFWPALAFLAFCLILLSIAFLSLWVANNSSEKRHKGQLNWPLRLVPTSTSSPTSTTTPKGKNGGVLPQAMLPGGEAASEEEGEADDDEEGEGEAPQKTALASKERGDKAPMAWSSSQLASPSAEGSMTVGPAQQNEKGHLCSKMPSIPSNEAHQFGVQPEELVRWMADGQMRRRLRLFEVRERNSHPPTPMALPSARVLLLSSLSHNGVPVHPLQFQRFLRSEEVDQGSVVLLYDVQSSQQLWAHYALWVFRLFGLDRSLLLMGAPNWTSSNGTSLAQSLDGMAFSPPNVSPHSPPFGTFRAQWRAEFISTFDDVLANFEREGAATAKADIVDAQTDKEFRGRSPSSAATVGPSPPAIFGHIRGAQSVPVESLAGLSPLAQSTLFSAQFGLSRARPVIVYDGFSSHRAAFVWTALRRANFSAELYFGAWPEWLVRAPDHLKVIPDN